MSRTYLSLPCTVALALLGLVTGCREASGTEGGGLSSAPTAAVVASPVAAASAASNTVATNKPFTVTGRLLGAYKVGQPGSFEVELVAGSGFKVNQEYPIKFKTEPTDTVDYPLPVVGKDGAKLEKTHAVVTVPFVPKSTGSKVLRGRLSFSVCTAEQCLVDKQDLALSVDVGS
jgi:hypothetical protein